MPFPCPPTSQPLFFYKYHFRLYMWKTNLSLGQGWLPSSMRAKNTLWEHLCACMSIIYTALYLENRKIIVPTVTKSLCRKLWFFFQRRKCVISIKWIYVKTFCCIFFPTWRHNKIGRFFKNRESLLHIYF